MSKPTNALKCIRVYYTHRTPPTCFSDLCGHLQGGALQRIHMSQYYRNFLNQGTDTKYYILKIYLCPCIGSKISIIF